MALLDVLLGGALALGGSVGGQLYAAKRERQRDLAAAQAARDARRRAVLLEAQQALADVVIKAHLARASPEQTVAFAAALVRAQSAGVLIPDDDVRDKARDYLVAVSQLAAGALPADARAPSATELTNLLGSRLRELDA